LHYVTARFIDNQASPIVGLVPKLDIWELETDTKVADKVEMLEVADGWYKYAFNITLGKNYVVSCDGGDTLSNDIRYQDGEIDTTISFISQIEKGRWKIENNQMKFYAEDNITEIAVYNLSDSAGNPTETNPAERFPV